MLVDIIVTFLTTPVSYQWAAIEASTTALMVLATFITLFWSFESRNTDLDRQYFEQKLKMFYDPLLYYFTVPKTSKEDFYEINKLLAKKAYLAARTSVNRIPSVFPGGAGVVSFPIGSQTAPITTELDGWYFNNDDDLQKWRAVFNILKEDRAFIIKEYYKAYDIVITNQQEEIDNRESNFKLNQMT